MSEYVVDVKELLKKPTYEVVIYLYESAKKS